VHIHYAPASSGPRSAFTYFNQIAFGSKYDVHLHFPSNWSEIDLNKCNKVEISHNVDGSELWPPSPSLLPDSPLDL
jgi:hypothetical protein